MVREAAAEVRSVLRRASGSRRTPRPPATAACTCTCASSRAGTSFGTSARRPSPSPGACRGRGPDLITATWWKEERGARVFVDFNQNAPHKTVFGAWCVRARAGRPGVDAVRAGTSCRRSTPTSSRWSPCRPRLAARRRPVGGDRRRAAVDRAAGRPLPSATWPTASPTPRGRRCTRRCPTRRRRVAPEPRPQTGLAPRLSASVSGSATPDVVFPDTETDRCHAGTSGASGSARAIRARPASTIAAPSQPAASRRSSSTTIAATAAVTGSASVSVTAVEVARVRRP